MPINESLKLSVLFGGSVKATASTTIVDTSRPAYEYILVPSNPSNTAIAEIDVPIYTITANKTTVNEGDSVVFTLTTTMLDAGTSVPYTISGVSVADISLSALTGNFVTDAAGKASLTFNIINDVLTEGNETMTLTLTGKGVSRSVTINDTSGQPTYSVGWYSNATGTTGITNTNEGTTAHLVVKTTNVTNGTNLSFSLGGTGINANDISGGVLSGTITINNNIGYVSLPLLNDVTTEGNETIVATVKNGTVTVGTSNLVINDTSKAPTYTLSSNITNVNEGSNVIITLTTTNVTNGTIVPYVITGVALADITLNSLSGNFTVNNNVATLTIPIVADNLTEGNETLVITLTGKNIAKSVIINDTSVTANTGYVFNSVKNNPAAAYEFRGINTVSYSVNLGWGKVHPGPFGSVVTDDLYVGTTKLDIIRVVNYYASLGYEDYAGYVEIDTSTNVPNINTATVKLTDLSNGTVVFNKSATIVNKNPLELFVSGVTSTAFDIPVGVQLKLQLTTT